MEVCVCGGGGGSGKGGRRPTISSAQYLKDGAHPFIFTYLSFPDSNSLTEFSSRREKCDIYPETGEYISPGSTRSYNCYRCIYGNKDERTVNVIEYKQIEYVTLGEKSLVCN